MLSNEYPSYVPDSMVKNLYPKQRTLRSTVTNLNIILTPLGFKARKVNNGYKLFPVDELPRAVRKSQNPGSGRGPAAAPKEGSRVERAYTLFKAGWTADVREVAQEMGLNNNACARDLVAQVRKWFRREGLHLAYSKKRDCYYLPDEHNYHEAAKDTTERLLPKLRNPQELLYDGIEQYAHNPELQEALEMQEIQLLKAVLNRREQHLISKNANS